jgi:hypothetical protein
VIKRMSHHAITTTHAHLLEVIHSIRLRTNRRPPTLTRHLTRTRARAHSPALRQRSIVGIGRRRTTQHTTRQRKHNASQAYTRTVVRTWARLSARLQRISSHHSNNHTTCARTFLAESPEFGLLLGAACGAITGAASNVILSPHTRNKRSHANTQLTSRSGSSYALPPPAAPITGAGPSAYAHTQRCVSGRSTMPKHTRTFRLSRLAQ